MEKDSRLISQDIEEAELLTIPEVAKKLTISVRQFYRQREYFGKKGLIKILLSEHCIRYKRSSISDLIRNLEKQNTRKDNIEEFKIKIKEHLRV